MTEYRQGNPYCIQIEPTEGCNLRCPFCGINGIRTEKKTYNFMSVDTATRVAYDMAKYKWNSRIEIAMHGEPLMNPNIHEIIQVFREYLPKAYILMESNGGPLIKKPILGTAALFISGLTTLALDEYQDISFVPTILKKIQEDIEEYDVIPNIHPGVTYYDYPSCGPSGNPHQRNKQKRLIRVRPIDVSDSGTHANINNHGGAGAPRNENAQGKRCAKPFREMSVRWDGGVAVCCNDWRGELPIGNINERTIEDIWHDPIFYAARRKLYAGERDFGACDGCDALSYRPGILPDHLGKEELDPPNATDEALLIRAISKGPMTTPVLRDWEK